jgi:monovalent cation/hydrogen antiporter
MLASQVLIVMVAAIWLTIFAERRGIEPPLLLAAVGLAASFLPGLPRPDIDPQIILGVVLPPLLYSAAVDFSFQSFIRRIGSILNLGVLLVVVTTVAVGAVVGWVLPSLTLPAALVVGAVVAPPDAVSAVAIGGKLGLPSRLMTILKGESLINDAAALTLFSAAIAASTGTHTLIASPWLYFLYAVVAGVIIGIVLGLVVHRIREHLTDPTLVTALAILTPFVAYALAQEISASGVIAVVFAGFTLGHNAAALSFAGRIREREVWKVIEALLEAFVFAYLGLQLRFVLDDASHGGFSIPALLLASGLALLTVIVVRIVWIAATALLAGQRYRRWIAAGKPQRKGQDMPHPLSWQENLALSWASMRGVVTLAAAVGTPYFAMDGTRFLAREAIIPIAFAVAVGTLLLQGLTLPLLIKRLKIKDDDAPAERRRQVRLAVSIMRQAAVDLLNKMRGQRPPEETKLVEQLLTRVQQAAGTGEDDVLDAERRQEMKRTLESMKDMMTAQRQALIAERDAGRLDDEVMRQVLENLDIEEAVVASRAARVAS